MPMHPLMDRRSFLTLIGVAGLTGLASQRWRPWLVSHDEGFCPGAGVALQLAADAPKGCRVRLRARHELGEGTGPVVAAPPGSTVKAETPYPFDDLIAGAYQVEAELLAPDGAVLQRLAVGGYSVRAYRFSA